MSTPRITYSLAVHNSAAYLRENVARLATRLRGFPGSEILLIENGSSDASLALSQLLAGTETSDAVRVVSDTAAKGYGNAHRRGLALARGDLVVMVGADLPFGFSDLDGWLARENRPALVLGSKAHPRSRITVSRTRRLMSAVFRVARRGLLGIGAGDTQGSVLISGELSRRLLPHLACSDYLVTTEVVAWAHELGVDAVEIPIEYPGPRAPSTVRPLADGLRMLIGLVSIRRRIRRERAARAAGYARRPAARHR